MNMTCFRATSTCHWRVLCISIAVLASSLGMSALGQSKPLRWERVHDFLSGRLTPLLLHGDSTLLIGSSQGGVARSTNLGAKWVANRSGVLDCGISSLTISPIDSIIYAATSDGWIIVSRSGGASWERFTQSPFASGSLFLDREGALYLYHVDYGVRRFQAATSEWAQMYSGAAAHGPLTLSQTRTGTFLVGTAMGVQRSTNRGVTWRATWDVGLPVTIITGSIRGVVFASWDVGLLRSLDDGETWERCVAPGDKPNTPFTYLEEAPDSTLYGQNGSGHWKTVDSARSWFVPMGAPPTVMTDLLIRPSFGFSGTKQNVGIYHCSDSTAQWMRHLTSPSNVSVWYLAFDPSGTLYLKTLTGLMRSSDAGYLWVPVGYDVGLITYGMLIDKKGHIYVYGEGKLPIARSTNGGGSWEGFAPLGPVTRTIVDALVDSSGLLMFADKGGRLFISRDAAKTWETYTDTTVAFNRLFRASDGSVFICTDGRGIRKSTDSGRTWTTPHAGNTVLAMYECAPEMLLLLHTYGMLVSTDRGTTWSQRAYNSRLERIVIMDKRGVLLSGSQATLDTGRTWFVHTIGVGSGDVTDYVTSPANEVLMARYQLFRLIVDTPTRIEQRDVFTSPSLRSMQIVPHPVTYRADISFTVTTPGALFVVIYDMTGTTVWRTPARWYGTGTHVVPWESPPQLSSGTYSVTVQSDAGLVCSQSFLFVR